MNYSKTTIIAIIALLTAKFASAGVTFSGTALQNAPELAVGDVGVLLVDNNNSGFSNITISTGSSLTNPTSYGNFSILASTTSTIAFGATVFSGAVNSFTLGTGVTPSLEANPGDKFGILVFSTSTTTAINGDTYRIWTDSSWIVPADGSTTTFAITPASGFFTTLTSAASFSGTVSAIPEPSTCAALLGAGVLCMAAYRRRRPAA